MPVGFVAGASWLCTAAAVTPSAVKTAQKANAGRFWTSFRIGKLLYASAPVLYLNDRDSPVVASQSKPLATTLSTVWG